MEKKRKKITEASKTKAADGNSSNTDCDQDSDVSFMNDTDEEIYIAEIEEEEEWIESHEEKHSCSHWADDNSPQSHAGSKHTEEWNGDQRWE